MAVLGCFFVARTMSPVAGKFRERDDENFIFVGPRGLFSGNDKLVGMCNELYEHRDWLWTLTEIEGIEAQP